MEKRTDVNGLQGIPGLKKSKSKKDKAPKDTVVLPGTASAPSSLTDKVKLKKKKAKHVLPVTDSGTASTSTLSVPKPKKKKKVDSSTLFSKPKVKSSPEESVSIAAPALTPLLSNSAKVVKEKSGPKQKDGPASKVSAKGLKVGKGNTPAIGEGVAKTQKKKKKKDKERLKQVTLSEAFKKTPTSNVESSSPSSKSKKKPAEAVLGTPLKAPRSEDPSLSAVGANKKKSPKRKLDVTEKPKKSKKKKMDVVEKTSNNHQKFDTIDISDNSTDSAELKIATNDDEDETSELSSEYDSSDSEHIMKNIKSFNKKGASKTVNKKDEPPPPKVKPKIYSSSEEGEGDSDEEDDDEEEADEKDGVKPIAPEDGHALIRSESDGFFNGWPKTDVEELIKRINAEIPKNDNIKASTRVKQLNWENIKFGSYTKEECLEKWKTIEKKIRGYRILEELLTDAKKWLEQPWTDFYKGNKKKNLRHPEMPKKPLTSYMIFYLKKKEKISKEFPHLSLTELSKVIADRFNKLAPTKKAKYNELALKMKEEYVTKMKRFAETHPIEMARLYNSTGRSRRAQNTMPGWSGGFKPLPPVKLYVEDKLKKDIAADPSVNQNERAAFHKEVWKTLSNKKKLPWIRWVTEMEAKYLDELKAYHAENPQYDMPKYKSVLLKEEKNILEKQQGKPDKPPPSAYLLFSSQMLKNPNLRKLTPKERMQETARLWKNVPKVEKDGYAEEVRRLADTYKLEYASWLETLPEERRLEELASNAPKRRGKDPKDGPRAKRTKTALKRGSDKPRMSLEEILQKEPIPPPKDAYSLFAQDYKNYPEKEIKKSWDALLDAPRSKLEARLAKLKQQYLLDFGDFLKTLNPEDLKLYSSHKTSQEEKIEVQLSESEEESEDDELDEEEDDVEENGEEDDEVEDDDEEEEAVAQAKVKAAAPLPKAVPPAKLVPSLHTTRTKVNSAKGRQAKGKAAVPAVTSVGAKGQGATKSEDESSDSEDEDDEEEEKADGVPSSSSSSESSSDEEEGSSSSTSSSSSSAEDNNIADAF